MIQWAGRQKLAKSSFLQRIWGLIYPWLVYEGVTMLVTFVFAFYMMRQDPFFEPTAGSVLDNSLRLSDQIYAYYIPLSLVSCLITIPLLILFMQSDRKKEIREGFETERWQKAGLPAFFLCLFMGASACVVLNHVLLYSGLYELLEEGFSDTAQILYQGNFWGELIVIGVLIPTAEELIFRGLVYRRIRWFLDTGPAMVISALLFAFFHGNLLQGIYAFILAMLMAFVLERTHSVLAPICFHVGANVISVMMTDLPYFNELYLPGHTGGFFLFTGIMMLLFCLCFYLFYTKVWPRRLDNDPAYGMSQTTDKEV